MTSSIMMVQRTVSCLLPSTIDHHSDSAFCDPSSDFLDVPEPTSPRSRSGSMKKNVVFADEAGQQLVTTMLFAVNATAGTMRGDRLRRTWPRALMRSGSLLTTITALSAERNQCANRLSGAIAAASSENNYSNPSLLAPTGQKFVSFRLQFAQFNAEDFGAFMRRASVQKIALENVEVNLQTGRVSGYVKVKNLTPEKEVFVRHTFDGWNTYKDVPCRYVIGVPDEPFDSFTFDFPLNFPVTAPPRRSTQRKPDQLVEFCLCYRPVFGSHSNTSTCSSWVSCATTEEYWDNNEGRNYVISLTHAPEPLRNSAATRKRDGNSVNDISDVYDLQLENWAIFAAWKHLNVSAPYW